MQLKVVKYSLGTDVSEKELEVCFKELLEDQSTKIKGSRKFPNTLSGFKSLEKWIAKRRKDASVHFVIVMEATGVYHENAAYYFTNAGYPVAIVLPNRTKDYLKSLGYKSKTDKIDGRGLAQLGAERNLRIWEKPNPHIVELRNLIRYKNTLEQMKTQNCNRLHAQQHSAGPGQLVIRELKKQIKSLKKQIATMNQLIEELLEKQVSFNEQVRKIADSINGVGIATVAAIAAETTGFELFYSQAQLTSYAGYDVIENQSGKRKGRTMISKKGNSHIRKALHFPALNVVRLEVETFSNLYERVYDRTRIKMKGYVAVQRKLLCMIYTLWKKNEAFDPNYQEKQEQVQALYSIPL